MTSPPLPFFIVDVFAEQQYAGNQLAVFPNAGHLSSAQMQQIAREINFSETTFVLSPTPKNGGYEVRIFTPAKELPFAGHPTLGTAFVLQQGVIREIVPQIRLNLPVGSIPVTLTYQGEQPTELWMQQNPPTFGETMAATAIAPVLNLDVADLDSHFPVQVVSTGMPFLIVPLRSLAALQRIRVNVERLNQLMVNSTAKEVFVFCPEVRHAENHFSARMFAPLLGIPEDPATGSANGCFAGYLVQHRYLDTDSISVRVEQGYEMGRPSLLLLQAKKMPDQISVAVGGSVILVARGEFV
jgi:trans-2,3-dihydro-3-hydroxyanthranilate isomerase